MQEPMLLIPKPFLLAYYDSIEKRSREVEGRRRKR
jgi:hypothetical protein